MRPPTPIPLPPPPSPFPGDVPQTLVQFGSTWCVKCHEFFPSFYKMSKQVRHTGGGSGGGHSAMGSFIRGEFYTGVECGWSNAQI